MKDEQALDHAAWLHRQAVVIDGHCDVLVPVADGRMRLSERIDVPDPASWQPPLGFQMSSESAFEHFSPHTCYFETMGQYDIPRLLEGGVTAQGFGIYLQNEHLDRALQRGLDMVYCLRHEAETNERFLQVTGVEDILRAKRENKVGGILTLEGFEALGSELHNLDLYHALGLRIASLTHCRRNLFADGPQNGVQTGGLTSLGVQAVRRMNELGIVVDLVHTNRVGFREALGASIAPVIISHCTVGSIFPDSPKGSVEELGGTEELEALAANGAVIGAKFYEQPSLSAVVDDIEYAIDAVGPDHVGLGSDLFGAEKSPRDLADMSRLPALTAALVERGHSDEVILKILGGNFLRVFREVWGR